MIRKKEKGWRRQKREIEKTCLVFYFVYWRNNVRCIVCAGFSIENDHLCIDARNCPTFLIFVDNIENSKQITFAVDYFFVGFMQPVYFLFGNFTSSHLFCTVLYKTILNAKMKIHNWAANNKFLQVTSILVKKAHKLHGTVRKKTKKRFKFCTENKISY